MLRYVTGSDLRLGRCRYTCWCPCTAGDRARRTLDLHA